MNLFVLLWVMPSLLAWFSMLFKYRIDYKNKGVILLDSDFWLSLGFSFIPVFSLGTIACMISYMSIDFSEMRIERTEVGAKLKFGGKE